MTARSTFFQQLLHTRWRIFEVFLMLLTCFCVSNQQTVGQSIHSNPCSAGGHTWRISCFLRGHAPSDKLRIQARQPHLHRVPRQEQNLQLHLSKPRPSTKFRLCNLSYYVLCIWTVTTAVSKNLCNDHICAF